MNILSNRLIATVGNEVQLKRIINTMEQDIRIENKRNMREFIKKKCKKRGANYGYKFR